MVIGYDDLPWDPLGHEAMPLGDQPVISFLFVSTLPSLFLIVGPLMPVFILFAFFVIIFCH